MTRIINTTLAVLIIIALFGCASDEAKKGKYFEKGKSYYEKGDVKSAIIELRNALKIDPKYLAAFKLLAEAQMKSGNAKAAFQSYSKIEQLDPDDIDAQIKLATFYLLGKKKDQALTRIEKVLRKSPDNIEALYLRAGAYGLDKDQAGAAETFQKIIALDGKQARAYIGLAQTQAAQRQFQAAEETLKTAVAIDPKDDKVRMALFGFYMHLHQSDEAEQTLREGIAADPGSADMEISLGSFMLQRNKKDEAEAAFKRALEKSPDQLRPNMLMAKFYAGTGRTDAAEAAYKNLLRLFPEDLRVLTDAAEFYFSRKNIDAAEQWADKALALRAKYTPAQVIKGQIDLSRNKADAAVALFDQLSKDAPDNAAVHYFKGVAYAKKGRTQIAREALYKALELNPHLIKANLLLAELQLADKNLKEAQSQCESVLRLDADNRRALNMLGRTFMLQRQNAAARKVYTRYIGLAPQDPAGYLRLGQIDFLDKQFDQALANYNKALEINPNLLDVFANVILVHMVRKEFDAALEMCDSRLQTAENAPEVQGLLYHFKGEIYQAKKDTAQAEAAFQTAIAKNPKLIKSYVALARIQTAQGNAEAAIAQYDAALAADPRQYTVHMALGTLYEIRKDFGQAEKHYRQALEINPDFAAAANNLAYLIVNKPDGDLNEALELARKAKAAFPDNPGVMDTIGWVYYKKNLFDSARVELMGSVEQMGDNPMVNYHLGMTMLKLEQKEMARQYLSKALALDGAFDGADAARAALAAL